MSDIHIDWPPPASDWPLPNGGVSSDPHYRDGRRFIQSCHVRKVLASANRRDAKWDRFAYWIEVIFSIKNGSRVGELIQWHRSA